MRQAFCEIQQDLQKLSLAVNLRKCTVWGPGAHLVKASPAGCPLREIPVTPYEAGSGLKVLGVPIGKPGETAFQDKLLQGRVDDLQKTCDHLSLVPDPQIQHVLLRQCLDAAKLQYAMRTTPTCSQEAWSSLTKADAAIFNVVEEMVGGGLDPITRAQVGLPFSQGGCGVRLPTHVRDQARLAGMTAYLQNGRRQVGIPEMALGMLPDDAHAVIAHARGVLGQTFDPLVDWARDPTVIAVADREYAKQSWWGDRFDSARRSALTQSVESRNSARLESQSGGYGSAWMQVVPTDAGQGLIKAEDYRLGLRWVLGLPLLGQDKEGAKCPACGACVDVFGDHLLCCRRNNFYGRHFAVQESFISMAQAGDQPFMREVQLARANAVPNGPSLRPADLLLKTWQGGKDLAVDITISHPLQISQQPWTAAKAKGYLSTVEKKKMAKYGEACRLEGWDFTGAAFDTWGGVGPGAKQLLFKLLRRAVGGVPTELRALRAQEHKQHLSLALMRQVWKLLSAKNSFA